MQNRVYLGDTEEESPEDKQGVDKRPEWHNVKPHNPPAHLYSTNVIVLYYTERLLLTDVEEQWG